MAMRERFRQFVTFYGGSLDAEVVCAPKKKRRFFDFSRKEGMVGHIAPECRWPTCTVRRAQAA
jgi:hypothetical protein